MAARAWSAGSREALSSGAGRGDLGRLVAHEPIHGEIIDLRGRSLPREGLPPLATPRLRAFHLTFGDRTQEPCRTVTISLGTTCRGNANSATAETAAYRQPRKGGGQEAALSVCVSSANCPSPSARCYRRRRCWTWTSCSRRSSACRTRVPAA